MDDKPQEESVEETSSVAKDSNPKLVNKEKLHNHVFGVVWYMAQTIPASKYQKTLGLLRYIMKRGSASPDVNVAEQFLPPAHDGQAFFKKTAHLKAPSFPSLATWLALTW